MSSYVNKRIRAFREAGDVEVVRKRSDGRMKTYVSATDRRAWCNDLEERRQYILDLVRQQGGGQSGKIIPLEAIVDIILSEKNVTIRDLQQEIDRLRAFIDGLNLTPEQRALLDKNLSEKELEKGAEEAMRSQKESGVTVDGKASGVDQTAVGRSAGGIESGDITDFANALTEGLKQLETIKAIVDDDGSDTPEKAKERSNEIDAIAGNFSKLKERLDKLRGLEDQVRKIKCGGNDELEKLRCKCKDAESNSARNQDEVCFLKSQLCEKDREIETLKNKCREVDVLKVEKNCLLMKVDELKYIEKEYEELLERTKGFDEMKAKYEQLLALEQECNEIKCKAQQCEALICERDGLLKEIETCECHITNRDEKINELVCHINCLEEGRDKQQDKMKTTLVTMRAKLEKKDNLIIKSEQKLADVQDQLRSSIEGVACETVCLKNYIDELEKRLAENDSKLQSANATIAKLQAQGGKGDGGGGGFGDEHALKIMKLSECAVQRVTEVLQKRLGEDPAIVEKQDTEGVGYEKNIASMQAELDKLRAQLAACQKELGITRDSSNLEITKMRDEAESARAENSALKRLSVQMQNDAKNAIGDMESQIKNKNDEINNLRSQSEQWEAASKGGASEDELNRLRSELKTCREQLTEAKTAGGDDGTKEMLEAMKKERDALLVQVKGSAPPEAAAVEVMAKPETADAASITSRRSVANIKKKAEEKKKMMDELSNDVSKLSEQQKTLDVTPTSSPLDDMKNKLDECEEKLKAALTAAAGSGAEDLINENERLKKRIAELEEKGGGTADDAQKAMETDDPEELKNIVKNLTEQLENQKKECDEKLEQMRKSFEGGAPPTSSVGMGQYPGSVEMPLSLIPEHGSASEQPGKKERKPSLEKQAFQHSDGTFGCGCPKPRSGPVEEQSWTDEGGSMSRQQAMLVKIKDVEGKLKDQQEKFSFKVELLQDAVEKFKKALEHEKEKNSELINRYDSQNKTVASMLIEMNMMKQENVNDKKQMIQIMRANEKLKSELEKGIKPSVGGAAQWRCLCTGSKAGGSAASRYSTSNY